MCWSRSTLLVCLLLISIPTGTAQGAGLLIPRDGSPPIQVKSHRVTATVEDGLAQTKVRQTFVNPHGRTLEAVYVFPVPDGAALVDLAMEVGGQRLEGFLAERQTARRAYNSIVRRGRDPALLEQIGRSTFRLSVFPVVPDQPTVVELTWIEAVPLMRGEYRYVFPLGMSGQAAKVEQDLTVAVTVKSSAPIVSIRSPTTGMVTHTIDAHEARASMEVSKAYLKEDVVVIAKVAAKEPTLAVRVYRPPTGDAFFAAVLTPPELEERQVLPRDITLAIDVSGSMKGEKLEQAKSAALWLLERLRARDRVNVLLFNDTVRRSAVEPQPANTENLGYLHEFVAAAKSGGGTALGDAIAAACSSSKEAGRVALAVILTDGLPTVGEKRPEAILSFSRAGAERGLRTFAFGVGDDVDAALLEGVATAGAGSAEIFRPQGEIATRLRAFLSRTESPAIMDLRVEIDGRPVDDLQPRPLPDIYLGEQAVITGRFRGDGQQDFALFGLLDGREIVLKSKVDFSKGAAHATVARDLYARAKLAFLQSALRLRKGLSDEAYYKALDRGTYSTQDELVDAEISLSLETGVQCAYTSLIALLPEDRQRLNPRDAVALDEALKRANARRYELVEIATVQPGALSNSPGPIKMEEFLMDDPIVAEEEVTIDAFEEDPAPMGRTTNDVIGVGGGAGGRYGGRYGGRGGGKGGISVSRSGVEWGLDWLSRHQEPDGRWSSGSFADQCTNGTCTGLGSSEHDISVTGMTLLSFLGSGNSAIHGKYKQQVRSGLKFLMNVQDPATGCFGKPGAHETYLFDHVLATLAMTEAYGLSKWPVPKMPATKAIRFLEAQAGLTASSSAGACHPALLGFVVLALRSASDFGIQVDPAVFDRLLRRIVECRVAPPENAADGAWPETRAETLAAIEILCRVFRGEDPQRSDELRTAARQLLPKAPAWNGTATTIDFHLCLFGSYAMFQVGGKDWDLWQKRMLDATVRTQRQDGGERGSWNPELDPWGKQGGRVYSTAILNLCLEVYYRYDRVVGAR